MLQTTMLIEGRGEQKTAATLSMEGIIKAENTLLLKLEKKGDLYTAYCSSDGLDFKKVGTAEIFRKQPSLNRPLKWLLIIYG